MALVGFIASGIRLAKIKKYKKKLEKRVDIEFYNHGVTKEAKTNFLSHLVLNSFSGYIGWLTCEIRLRLSNNIPCCTKAQARLRPSMTKVSLTDTVL